MKHLPFILILWTVFSNITNAQTSRVVSGSTNFSVKFVLGTCDGTFDAPKGTAVFDENNPGKSSFNLTIDASSFQTGNKTRDKDMKSEKYFHVAKFPEIRFKSSKIEKSGNNYRASGTLIIRDVSKNVTLPFDAKKNKDGGYTLSSQFEVNRLDYQIGEKDWKLKDIVTVQIVAEIH
ncbi:YceI family protein [Dyadobacter luteus]|uniref:YceI family protein n=1 Tax=Dyadobacter luteus TaxID=2259619 RepID=A0A3D8YBI4_9BACT|nr:YceI family protein [Dyadobacter luteus]REA61348.1 YceI family protein [Dyadobacter luteus]